MTRAPTPRTVETAILLASRRRCAICFGLLGDQVVKAGQIAHVDRDASNSVLDNLAWLCLAHHDEYDTRRSQSKGFTPDELRRYRDELHRFVTGQRGQLEPNRPFVQLSPEGAALAALLNQRSRNGYKLDPQIRIDGLATLLELGADDVELAIDDLRAMGLLEINASRDAVFPTNRLFWETDPLFGANDPAGDAEAVAGALVAHTNDSIAMADLATVLDWSPRRLNPAASYLVETNNAYGLQTIGSAPFWYREVSRTSTTKRLVRGLERRGRQVSTDVLSNVPGPREGGR